MDTKTLDERIREKARRENQTAIAAAFKRLSESLPQGDDCGVGYYDSSLIGDKGVKMNIAAALQRLEGDVVRHTSGRAEQNAINAFLGRVDSLKAEVDELRDGITE